MISSNGIWRGEDPLSYSLPLFVLQLSLIIIVTRTLVFLLKPLRQPRVVSEILGGLILGPSVMGKNSHFSKTVFPLHSIAVLETMANLGLLYFLFLVGVEMDINVIRRTGRKAMVIAISGMALPFLIGSVTSYFLRNSISTSVNQTSFLLFLGVALSVTAFPVLARILAELKLLNTELGRIAMSSAIINDLCAWILLALAIALTDNSEYNFASLWIVLCGTAYILFCIFIVRPAIGWVIKQTPEGEAIKELHVCIILTGVLISGFITDAIGIHAIFGAFVFGLVIPSGPLGVLLIEKLEDFVSGLLLPLFFAISGLRANLSTVTNRDTTIVLVVIIVIACICKVVATLIVALFYGMPLREGFSLGMLMNTKGLIEMIVLNVGRDQKVLDEPAFAIMVMTAVVMTGMITPVVTSVYRPARRFIAYKRRTIQRSKADAELRLLACIHSPRSVPTIINLLEASRPTKRSPIFVYALHLVELTGRASAMLIVHSTRKNGRPPINRTQAHSDHIVSAFENYEMRSSGVAVQPLTAISPYSTMHEDICDVAEDKRVALIILPFHKQQTVDGGMEAANPAAQTVNQNVLANAPCSVGILVDRGLGGATHVPASHVQHHVGVLFFGGPDDREALAYAWRMAEHPGVTLTVIRFIVGDNPVDPAVLGGKSNEDGRLSVITDNEREKQLDDDYINQFRLKHVSNESVVYTEKVTNNAEETVAAIRNMSTNHDLYIVGRGQGMVSPLTAGMMEWSECPELGAIGDFLASADFALTVSVLVMQQYVGTTSTDGLGTPDSPGKQVEQYLGGNNDNRRHRASQALYQPQPRGNAAAGMDA
ncbi:cation/H(+) antiporter 15-like [Magnolia sinica]|uniref:cation/H(+) antiporter 15-like n=1 Tax=Magnolia sinica TaxID=86752 RepID=UPI002658BD96|nr:cation/H(+) antiporter 15-like [Magnolia sinica]